MFELYDRPCTRRAALRYAFAGVAAVAGLGLSGCGGTSSEGSALGAGTKAVKIGVLQLVEHAALDASNKGFVAALDASGLSYEIDQQNAQGDQSACQTIAHKFVSDGDTLIFAIATPAAQAVASATSEIPIVGTAITDFAAAGLVESNEKPGGNITGSSDLTPVDDQIDLLVRTLPKARQVGLLYCTAEANSQIQIEMAERALDARGIGHTRYTVASSNEIQQVVESAVGKVDALYAPTDNTIAAGMATVAMVAKENRIPTVVGCDTMVKDGGMMSYSINYEDLGRKAGEMAVKILTGKATPAEMPIETLSASECKLIVNAAMAEACGVDISGLSADITV
ncbi:ABC transporter substrate-binding protein [Collinsella sp. AGMB00827]|uniref:ABC transporter substrate-binding protein n=1 Tax=Collinsella ureilytica TaxID=2869515 RepID=A0ABS7MIH2_9ACTN|nr:ABC transporter substrate-binding protein [Collinsella urealyticum]MBY4797172.1 ABC transporter substrate-binding protein [Collinsella urealyticum]